ncbi:dihydropteroate synthase [Changpingibacter yushuensis]|uniref:dihydropteroate synthase n=1 Tax=Changpingibacter yushuensis TaxID=2758440 RepID=UPI0021CDD515|nr:dihydropteroate synthase [Changpingibacter yushuensis]
MAVPRVLRHLDRTLVMGILNITPDSFSDGGRWVNTDTAIAHGHRLIEQGADIIDVGGESSRPGARPLTADEEWDRVGAVIKALAQTATPISVDTYHAETARRAVEAGAAIVNDVTGGAGDPAMFSTVSALGCPYILQHTRGTPSEMNSRARYANVSGEVSAELQESIDRAVTLGVARSNIIIDPGFGFAKNGEQNWDLAAHFEDIEALGMPILIGVSRKHFLAGMAPGPQPADRDDLTAAMTSYFALRGVWAVRVHEVAASHAAVLAAQHLRHAGMPTPSWVPEGGSK